MVIAAMTPRTKRIRITDLNASLICLLCKGYLIDATTITECLHSYEMLRRRRFYSKNNRLALDSGTPTGSNCSNGSVANLLSGSSSETNALLPTDPEQLGVINKYSHLITADEKLSISLEFMDGASVADTGIQPLVQLAVRKNFLSCPAIVVIRLLKKWLSTKFALDLRRFQIEIFYEQHLLYDDLTLMDVAYLYVWQGNTPMNLKFKIYEKLPRIIPAKREKIEPKLPVVRKRLANEADEAQLRAVKKLKVEKVEDVASVTTAAAVTTTTATITTNSSVAPKPEIKEEEKQPEPIARPASVSFCLPSTTPKSVAPTSVSKTTITSLSTTTTTTTAAVLSMQPPMPVSSSIATPTKSILKQTSAQQATPTKPTSSNAAITKMVTPPTTTQTKTTTPKTTQAPPSASSSSQLPLSKVMLTYSKASKQTPKTNSRIETPTSMPTPTSTTTNSSVKATATTTTTTSMPKQPTSMLTSTKPVPRPLIAPLTATTTTSSGSISGNKIAPPTITSNVRVSLTKPSTGTPTLTNVSKTNIAIAPKATPPLPPPTTTSNSINSSKVSITPTGSTSHPGLVVPVAKPSATYSRLGTHSKPGQSSNRPPTISTLVTKPKVSGTPAAAAAATKTTTAVSKPLPSLITTKPTLPIVSTSTTTCGNTSGNAASSKELSTSVLDSGKRKLASLAQLPDLIDLKTRKIRNEPVSGVGIGVATPRSITPITTTTTTALTITTAASKYPVISIPSPPLASSLKITAAAPPAASAPALAPASAVTELCAATRIGSATPTTPKDELIIVPISSTDVVSKDTTGKPVLVTSSVAGGALDAAQTEMRHSRLPAVVHNQHLTSGSHKRSLSLALPSRSDGPTLPSKVAKKDSTATKQATQTPKTVTGTVATTTVATTSSKTTTTTTTTTTTSAPPKLSHSISSLTAPTKPSSKSTNSSSSTSSLLSSTPKPTSSLSTSNQHHRIVTTTTTPIIRPKSLIHTQSAPPTTPPPPFFTPVARAPTPIPQLLPPKIPAPLVPQPHQSPSYDMHKFFEMCRKLPSFYDNPKSRTSAGSAPKTEHRPYLTTTAAPTSTGTTTSTSTAAKPSKTGTVAVSVTSTKPTVPDPTNKTVTATTTATTTPTTKSVNATPPFETNQ